MSVWSPDIAFDPDCETFADQASVMPRLIGNKIPPLLYGETFRMRTDVMKDFQDTAEKQEERWLVKFGKDVLADLHGVCPIVVLAAQEIFLANFERLEGHVDAQSGATDFEFLLEPFIATSLDRIFLPQSEYFIDELVFSLRFVHEPGS